MGDSSKSRPDKKAIRQKIRALVCDTSPASAASLATVKNEIAQDLGQLLLSSTDEHYVNVKYFKYCRGALDNGILNSASLASKNASQLKELGMQIMSAKKLKELPTFITSEQPHYMLLWEERRLLDTRHQQLILKIIKSAMAKVITRITSTAGSKQSGIAGYLQLARKCCLSFYNVWRKMTSGNINDAYPADLQAYINEIDPVFEVYQAEYNKLRNEMESYKQREFGEQYALLEPDIVNAVMEMENSIFKDGKLDVFYNHGRYVLVLEKPVILLSLHWIEGMLQAHPEVEEVHLVTSEVIFINCHLENDKWHGKNILVFGTTIEVVIPRLRWDISGLPGESGPGEKAADGSSVSDPDGKDGKDATSGESGGYCTLIAENFLNMSRLTVKMNGGNGGSGQSAGDGIRGSNGSNGEEWSVDTLLSEFPTGATATTAIEQRNKSWKNLEKYIVRNETKSNDYYWHKKGYFSDGKLVEWGWSRETIFVRRSYCLVKGTLGTAGQAGGFKGNQGMGGKGGYAGALGAYKLIGGGFGGAVPLNNIGVLCETSAGQDGPDGEDGKDGKDGTSGRNGHDVGYTDSSQWRNPVTHCQFTSKIKAYDYANKTSNSVWCWYYRKYIDIGEGDTKPTQVVQKDERKRRTKIREKMAATRNNTINHSLAVTEYAQVIADQKASVNADVAELEFQRTMNEVINQSEKLLEEEKAANAQINREQKNRRHHAKVTVNRSGPNEGKFNERTDKETRKERKKAFMDGKDHDMVRNAGRWGLEELSLQNLRSRTFEKIREKVEQTWAHYDRTKVEYQKKPTSTEDKASALHALFGERSSSNLGFYVASPTRSRQEVNEHLKKNVGALLEGEESWVNLRESLSAFFDDKSIHDDAVEGEDKLGKLKKYRSTFKQNPEAFPWDELRKDEKAVEEYVKFLGESEVHLLISDLRLVAGAYGISEELYMSHDKSCQYRPLRPEVPGETRVVDQNAVRIAVNENHEFLRMDPVLKSDWSGRHEQMRGIVRDLQGLNGITEMEEYLNAEQFGVAKQVAAKKLFSSEEAKKWAVEEIFGRIYGGGRLAAEKLTVKTSLLRWPELALKLFHGRIMMETCKKSKKSYKKEFELMFTKITEAIINGSGDDEGVEQLEKELAPYMWITAAYPLHQWSTELCLLVLQEHFDQVKYAQIQAWRKILDLHPSKLVDCVRVLMEGENDFDVKDINGFTSFLESFKDYQVDSKMDFDQLEEIQRALWPFLLRKLFLTRQLEKLPKVDWTEKRIFDHALYYLHTLYNENPKEVKHLLKLLHSKLEGELGDFKGEVIKEFFQKFYGGQWSYTEEVVNMLQDTSVGSWVEWLEAEVESRLSQDGSSDSKTRTLAEVHKMVENDSNTTLEKDELGEIVEHVQNLDQSPMPSNFGSEFNQIMTAWLADFRKRETAASSKQERFELHLEVVNKINWVFELNLGYGLRPTQKLAVVSALHQGTLKNRNLISQIATGEGKTCVVLAVAICRGLSGERSDVVTSSKMLAQRDATVYKDIYSAFGLTVGEVTSENQEERRKAYLCTVVYGEATHFQRDFLLDKFFNQNIKGSRPSENVLVDEVDCMFLDKGNSVLYLGHQPPDMDSLEALFVFIWRNVVDSVNKGEYQPMVVHELVLSTMYPTITVKDLLTFATPQEVNPLWDWLVSNKVVNKHGRILKGHGSTLPEKFKKFQTQLRHLIDSELTSATNQLGIMNYLKPFVEQHLMTWIHSAFQATQLTQGREYAVDVDHENKIVLDRNPRIIPLDLDTGVDMKQSQWNEGLHQFLELKHGCRLSPMSLKSVFVSGITFFNKYKRVFGLTGTIGTEADRQFLKDAYKVQILGVPLAQQKRFLEEEPIVCHDDDLWKKAVVRDAVAKVGKGRSVLIICGTVQDAEVLFKAFSNDKLCKDKKVGLYRRDYEEFKATQEGETLGCENIIIATNLAGRGTDLKLSPVLREKGGLHVILSYLPDNLRVEQQAFGRAARGGDPGSGVLIFKAKISKTDGMNAIDMKIKRDEREMRRVSDLLTYYSAVILKEEDMFREFQLIYDRVNGVLQKLYPNSNKKEGEDQGNLLTGQLEEMRDVILYSMLDAWAFWLDKFSTILQNKLNEKHATLFDTGMHIFDLDMSRCKDEFLKFTTEYEGIAKKFNSENFNSHVSIISTFTNFKLAKLQVETNGLALIKEPALLVKAAKVKITEKEWEVAEGLLNRAIEMEPNNGRMVAKYYKLFCRIKRGLWRDSSAFETLTREVLEGLEEWRLKESGYAAVIKDIECVDTTQISHGDGYKEQKASMMNLIGVLIQSVENMVGKAQLTGEDFGRVCATQVAARLIPRLVTQGALEEIRLKGKVEESKMALVAKECSLEVKEVERIWEKHGGKVLSEVENKLAEIIELPSREGFCEQIKPCLEDVQEFAVVQRQTEGMTEEELKELKCEINEFEDWAKCRGGKWMVSKHGTAILTGNNLLEISKGSEQVFKQQRKYRYLRNVGRLCYEQVATVNLDKLKTLQLSKFCKTGKDVFNKIPGVAEQQGSRDIFEILEKARIVASDGELLTAEWGADKLNLTLKWEVYRADILAILQCQCRYKYQLLSILFEAEKPENVKKSTDALTEFKVSLPPRPYKDFVMCCMDHGLIQGHKAKASHFQEEGVSNFFVNIFKEPASWGMWIVKRMGICREQKAKLTWSDLCGVFKEESESDLRNLFQQLKSKSWINEDDEILEIQPGNNLTSEFEYYEADLRDFLLWQQHQVKESFWKEAFKIVYESQGKLKTLENPDSALVDIEEHLGKGSAEVAALQQEIIQLALSSLDHIVDIKERTYTLKMIFSAIAVIIIGLAQIAVGCALKKFLGAGSFVASGFISEGISDIIYGARAFMSGHFSWQDWVNNKWQSIAFTVAFMGVGAMFCKGVKYSTYGARLFGEAGKQMGGRAIVETLKETGKTGIKRTLAPVMLQTFGSTVLRGVAEAACSIAVSYAYDAALKNFIDNLSCSLFAKTNQAVEQHPVSETLSQLCDLCGVTKAQEIVNRCRGRVESTYEVDAHECIGRMMGPLRKGLKEATSKMKLAGTSGLRKTLVVTLMNLATTATVVSAMTDIATSIGRYLNQIEQEIRKEMGVFQKEQESAQTCTASEKQDFIYQFKGRTNDAMKEKIGGIMRHKLIEPLMNAGCKKLLSSLGRGLSKLKENWSKKKVEANVKLELKQNPGSPEAVTRDLHKQVMQLSSTSRDPKLIAFVVESGGPLGAESVQALANMLGVTIVVDSNNKNIPGVFEPNGGDKVSGGKNGNGKTLHLKHTTVTDDPNDWGHWEAESSKGTTLKGAHGSADCLLDAINAELTTKLGEGHSKIDRTTLAKSMRQDGHFGELIKNGWHHTLNSVGGFRVKPGSSSPADKEVTDQGRKDSVIKHIEEIGLRMRTEGRLVTREDNPQVSSNSRTRDHLGPIDAYATETVNGKDVIYYQETNVNWKHIQKAEQQSRNRKDEKLYTMEDGCPKHDHAGHVSSTATAAPTWKFNLSPQNATVNQGVNREIEKLVTNWVREGEIPGQNASRNTVKTYELLENRGGPRGRRPETQTHYYIFKTDGKVAKSRVFVVDNPACHCILPERGPRARVAG